MNRLQKFVLFFSLLTNCVAIAGERQVDSLKSLLGISTGDERVKILLSLMEEVQRSAPEEAINYGNEALGILKEKPESKLEIEVLYNKGWAYLYLNELDSAKAYSKLVESKSKRVGLQSGIVRSKFLNARIMRTDGQYEEAINILQSALEEIETDRDAVLKAKLLNELGSVNRRLSKNEESLANHTKALELLNELKSVEELTQTYTYLGITNDVLGNYDDALKYHQMALRDNRSIFNTRGIAASTHNIGILYQKLGQYDKSLEYYNQALNYWKELGEINNLASTLNSIGGINELTGNLNEALVYYKQALAIWEKSGSKYSIAIALNNIGSIYLSLKNYSESLKYLTRSIEIRRSLGDKGGLASSLLVLADLYNHMGNVDRAISTGREGLKLAEETGSWSTIREARNVLAYIYEQNGFYKEALAQFKEYKAVHDSIFNSQKQETIAELEAKYKTEEQKQQIELLQRKSEIQNLYRTVLISGLVVAIIFMILLYNRYRFKKQAHETLEKFHKSEMDAAEAKAAVLQIEFEQKKKELESARELQLSMLPAKIPNHPGVEIAAFMQTATEVGGDYYDFHQHPDGALTIVIGDATGHGAKAGTIVTATKSLFNLLSQSENIADILNHINYSIRKMHFPNLFMAMGLVKLKNDLLELAGAGMPPALIYRASTGQIESASLKGLPLGSFADFSYSKISINLNKDDVVVLMSDGFPELFNEKFEMFGYDNVIRKYEEVVKESPEKIIEHFSSSARQWLNGGKQQDDITFVVFKVK